MKITHYRLDNNQTSCRGVIYIDDTLFGFVMEDPVRTKKIKDVTAIPAGKYEIIYQENITPKTQAYRQKYDWFGKHLMLKDIPNYKTVYDHIGNYPTNTEGCRLINNIMTANDVKQLGQSTPTFKRYYLKVTAALDRGDKVETEIINLFEQVGQKIINESE